MRFNKSKLIWTYNGNYDYYHIDLNEHQHAN